MRTALNVGDQGTGGLPLRHKLNVYEPFLGSSTTLIAAEATGRICLAVEIDPLYVDVAIRRWQAFTGKQAILQAGGKTINTVAAERSKTGGQPVATAASRRSNRKSAKGA